MIPRSTGVFTREKAAQNGYGKEEIVFFERLIRDFFDFKFVLGAKFSFRPPKTIVIGPPEPFSRLLVLHELGHAVCGHRDFRMDITRL